MIDFRYHLVSLISVFLALAVGIILGAGPLQGALGDQLTDQVETLRTERNELRDALDASQRNADLRLQFIEAAGPSLVNGAIEGLRVAVVALDDAAGDHHQAVVDGIEAAGGRVVASSTLQPAWTSAEHEDLRDTLAEGMRARVREAVPALAPDAATDDVIAAALGVALSGQETTANRSGEAVALERQLVQAGFLAVEREQPEPADLVVVLAGTVPEEPTEEVTEDAEDAEEGEASPAPDQPSAAAFVVLARGVQRVAPTVVVGPSVVQGDVVSAIRADSTASRTVSTVSGVETLVGRIVVPLAAAAQFTGQVGQYGFEDGATVLPPDVRGQWTVPADPEEEPEGGAEPQDGEPQDGEPQDGVTPDGEAPAEGDAAGDAGAQDGAPAGEQ